VPRFSRFWRRSSAADAVTRHAPGPTAVYGAAIGLSVFLIDAAVARWPVSIRELPVRSPRLEALVAAITALVSFGCLWLLFVSHYRPNSPLATFLVVVPGLGSVFGVTLALFLLARGYGPSDLGLRVEGLSFSLPVITVFGVLAFAFNRAFVLIALGSWGGFAGSLAGMPAAALSGSFSELSGRRGSGMARKPRSGLDRGVLLVGGDSRSSVLERKRTPPWNHRNH
jgi:hypothetical protein